MLNLDIMMRLKAILSYLKILCSSLNYDGKILVTAGKDRMVKLWDTSSNQLIQTLKSIYRQF
jgi:WD40 repeat protein